MALGLGLLAFALSLGPPARAGTVLATPARAAQPGSEEQYPESKFGTSPTQWHTGVDSGYASRAVINEETDEDGTPVRAAAPERGPASALGASGPNDPGVLTRKGVQEVALIAGDLGFFPKTFFVTRDVPVRLFVTGASRSTLCIMMDSFQVRKQVRSQKIEEITFTPATPGKFRFYCPVNGMEGTMVVKELVSAAAP
jgi:hypothetical protein